MCYNFKQDMLLLIKYIETWSSAMIKLIKVENKSKEEIAETERGFYDCQ